MNKLQKISTLVIAVVGVTIIAGLAYRASIRTTDKHDSAEIKVTNPDTSVPTTTATPKKAAAKPITLIFGGDVMLSRVVGTKMANLNDWTAPWKNISKQFSAANIAFVNLEGAFSDQGPRAATTGFLFKDEPQAVAGLEQAGIDIVSTANNHVTNAGKHGIEYTLDFLPQHNIKTAGTGKTFAESHAGTILESQGEKIGFLAYTYDQTNNDPSAGLTVNSMDVDQLKKDITALQPNVDAIIVSMHAGAEYTRTATTQQTTFAHAAIDAGATLVIGTHPHVIQPIEEYKGRYIFYCLGNLIFDQNWSVPTTQGLVTRITMTKETINKIELAPVVIEQNYLPRFVTDTSKIKDILSPVTYPDNNLFQLGLQ